MPKYEVVLKETVLHTVVVDNDDVEALYETSVSESVGELAIEGFNSGQLVDTDAEQLELEVVKVNKMEETDAEV